MYAKDTLKIHSHLTQYIDIRLSPLANNHAGADFVIHSKRDYTKLYFTPDTPPLFIIEAGIKSLTFAKYELEYDTGDIIGLKKQCQIYI